MSTGYETRLRPNPRDGIGVSAAGDAPIRFHQRLPGYQPTPTHDLASLAADLDVGGVIVKDESSRLGLPSFKLLGASWATFRAVVEHTGIDPDGWATLDDLAGRLRSHRPLTVAAATDGNHGRAVARMARLLGLDALIWVPKDTVEERIEAIRSEGADIVVFDGNYDDAVQASAVAASDTTLVVSDTAWEGYETIPGWVIEGYSTIFTELDSQLAAGKLSPPSHVVVPMGVGALAAAAVAHFDGQRPRPLIIGVEPTEAACIQAAVDAGEVVTIESEFRTSMVGLNCGTASPIAFPILAAGLDWTIAIDDGWAENAMRLYAQHGLVAGETGAASLGALLALTQEPDRDRLHLDRYATVLLILTEGATDPVNYHRVVGRHPHEVAG